MNIMSFLKKIKKSLLIRLVSKLFKSDLKMVGYIGDHISLSIAIFGRYEKEILDKLKFVLKDEPKLIAIDIGANIGNHTLWMAENFDTVLSFEPTKITYEILKLNLMLNDRQNVKTFNFGLGSFESAMQMIHANNNSGAAKILRHEEINFNNTENVVIKIGDEVISKMCDPSKITLIKIDVEGYEYEVLLGIKKILTKNSPTVVLEIENDKIREKYPKSIGVLIECGYHKFSELDDLHGIANMNKIDPMNMRYKNYAAIICQK